MLARFALRVSARRLYTPVVNKCHWLCSKPKITSIENVKNSKVCKLVSDPKQTEKIYRKEVRHPNTHKKYNNKSKKTIKHTNSILSNRTWEKLNIFAIYLVGGIGFIPLLVGLYMISSGLL